MNQKNILLTISLLSVFLVTSILALFTAKKFTTSHINSAKNPDFFMTGASYTKFNPLGQIRNQVQTNKITHFAANNSYFFENPRIIMHNLHEQPWHITANKGRSEQGKSKIYLWDQVKIMRAAGVNNSDCDIATSALTIYPDLKTAKTKQPITIIQNDNLTTAVGAEADFKTGVIKLLSKINSIYKAK